MPRLFLPAILLVVFLASLSSGFSQCLSGSYTVGGFSPDYNSLSSAASDLDSYGVCGSVTFFVRDGTYNEQVSIGSISGASNSNTISFVGENGPTSLVNIDWGSSSLDTNNFVLRIDSADHLSFRYLNFIRSGTDTYARVVEIQNEATHLSFLGNTFETRTSAISGIHPAIVFSDSSNNNDLQFIGNTFVNGGSGIHIKASDSLNPVHSIQIDSNTFNGQYYQRITFVNADSIQIWGNTINGSNSSSSGQQTITIDRCLGQMSIIGNRMNGNTSFQVIEGYGIFLRGCRTSAKQQVIANNLINIKAHPFGYGILFHNCDSIQVVHNTIHLGSGTAIKVYAGNGSSFLNNLISNAARGFQFSDTTCVSVCDYNAFNPLNIIDYGNLPGIDYNDLLEWQNQTPYGDHSTEYIPDFLGTTDFHISSDINFHNLGTPTFILTDFDQITRDTVSPDIGAYEFDLIDYDATMYSLSHPDDNPCPGLNDIKVQIRNTGSQDLFQAKINLIINGQNQPAFFWNGLLAVGEISAPFTINTYDFQSWAINDIKVWVSFPNDQPDQNATEDTIHVTDLPTRLTGSYTIGGISPVFSDFTQAVSELHYRGVCGPVDFLVRQGHYDERLVFNKILGASPNSLVTFRSEFDQPIGTVLRSSVSGNYASTEDCTILFHESSDIVFSHLTIERYENQVYSHRAIEIRDSCQNIQLRNNRIFHNDEGILVVNFPSSALKFTGNTIEGGEQGIQIDAIGSDNLLIENNLIRNTKRTAIAIEFASNLRLIGNHCEINLALSSPPTNQHRRGIHLTDCDSLLEIRSNEISFNDGSNTPPELEGIVLSDCPLTAKAIVANNRIHLGGPSSFDATGIFLDNIDSVQVLHNSINITSLSSESQAFRILSAVGVTSKNNIFSNSGGGRAMRSLLANSLDSDYNNLYTSGSLLVNAQGSLAAWQGFAGGDSSISVLPPFISNNDLRILSSAALEAAGTPILLHDFEGDLRSTTAPDLGADEFSSLTNYDAGIASIVSPNSTCHGYPNVVVRIANFGTDTIHQANVEWEVNGVGQPTFQWYGSLAPGDTSTDLTIGSYSFMQGTTYTVKTWTAKPGDLLASNDTSSISNFPVGLGGAYTVGGASPDFISLQDAFDALEVSGFCDSVTFQLRPGHYMENLNLAGPIPGNSSSNSLQILSETGLNTSVILEPLDQYLGGLPLMHTAQFSEVEYLTLKNLTLRRTANDPVEHVLGFIDSCDHLSLMGNRILNEATDVWPDQLSIEFYNIRHVQLENNRFSGGNGAFFDQLSDSVFITNNEFLSNYFHALRFEDGKNIYITNNLFENSVWFDEVSENLEISGNRFHKVFAGFNPSSLSLINIDSGHFTASDPGLIANNFINIDEPWTATDAYTIRAHADFLNIYHNTIRSKLNVLRVAGDDIQLLNNIFIRVPGGPASPRMILDLDSAISLSDYNCFYIDTNQTFASVASNLQSDFSDWQTNTTFDSNSLFVEPPFYNPPDLHIFNTFALTNNAGTPLPMILTDIDSEVRSPLTPDIGADEYDTLWAQTGVANFEPMLPTCSSDSVRVRIINYGTVPIDSFNIHWEVNGVAQTPYFWSASLSPGDTSSYINIGSYSFNTALGVYNMKAWTAQPQDNYFYDDTASLEVKSGLHGVYTIGGTAPDYPTLKAARIALETHGICDSVFFDIRDGFYATGSGDPHILELPAIKGSAPDKTITFRSESQDSSAVIIWRHHNKAPNYIVLLDGASYVYFEHLSFARPGGGTLVNVKSNSHHNQFNHCHFEAAKFINSGPLVENKSSHITFTNNSFSKGWYAIESKSTNQHRSTNIVIRNNRINSSVRGIDILSNDSVSIADNYITNCSQSIAIRYSGPTWITGNQLYSSTANADRGIWFFNQHDSTVVANNMVSTSNASGSARALDVFSSSSIAVHHNSFRVTGASPNASSVAYFTNSDSIELTNNVFSNVNADSGRIFSMTNSSAIHSNYNAYHYQGNKPFVTDTMSFDLPAWKTSSGLDSHSIVADPWFIGADNLHATQLLLDSAGSATTGILQDLDKEIRNPVAPDIGADEFNVYGKNGLMLSMTDLFNTLCEGSQPIQIRFRNIGSETIDSMSFSWSVNQVNQGIFTYNGSIAPGEEDTVTAGNSNLTNGGMYDFKFWITGVNGAADENPANDTLEQLDLTPTMSGIYTIKGTNPDYPTIGAAIEDLKQFGICGPVVFNLRPGSYTEVNEIPWINGSSAINTITFQSENLDSTSVVIQTPTVGNEEETFLLSGTGHIRFRHLTLLNLNSSADYVLEITDGGNDIVISNCVVVQSVPTQSSNFKAVVSFDDSFSPFTSCRIENCLIRGGYNSIEITGNGDSANAVINTRCVAAKRAGIRHTRQTNLTIAHNYISSRFQLDFTGILSIQENGGGNVENNRIVIENDGIGISVQGGNSLGSGLDITNNEICVEADFRQSCGILMSTTLVTGRINHNSINVYSVSTPLDPTFLTGMFFLGASGSSTVEVKNNNVSMPDGGYAKYIVGNDLTPYNFDYNNLYTSDSNLIYYSGNFKSLAGWQAQSGMDSNSLSLKPQFVSDTNLHITNQVQLDNKGTFLPYAPTTDVDLQSRSLQTPDIGMDEFETALLDGWLVAMKEQAPNLCPGSSPIEVIFRNNGLDTIYQTEIQWTVDGVSQAPLLWNDTLPSGQDTTIFLGNMTVAPNQNVSLDFWLSQVNTVTDSLPSNDSLSDASKIPVSDLTLTRKNPTCAGVNDGKIHIQSSSYLGPLSYSSGSYQGTLTPDTLAKWYDYAAGNWNNIAEALTVTNTGDLVTGGYFGDQAGDTLALAFDTLALTNQDYGSDGLIRQFSPNGQLKWHLQVAGSGFAWIRKITSDNDGNVWATGRYANTIYFGADTITGGKAFLLKADSAGNPIKGISLGFQATNSIQFAGIDCDHSGNVFLALRVAGTIEIDSQTYNVAGTGLANLLIKYNANGDLLWANFIDTDQDIHVNDMVVDNAGRPIIAGIANGNPQNSYTFFTLKEGHNPFFVRFKSDGAFDFARNWGAAPGELGGEASSISVGPDGKMLMAGTLRAELILDEFVVNGPQGTSWWAQLDTNGVVEWMNSSSSLYVKSVGKFSNSQSALAFELHDSITINNTFYDPAQQDMLGAYADKNGKLFAAESFGLADGQVLLKTAAFSNEGDLYFSTSGFLGFSSDTVQFGHIQDTISQIPSDKFFYGKMGRFSSSAAIDSLPPGTYTVEVTDNNGCLITDTITLQTPPNTISLSTGSSSNPCFGDTLASMWASYSNGVAPYNLLWSTTDTTDTVQFLTQGQYNITVTDSVGHCISDSVTITDPAMLSQTLSQTNPLCFGDSTGLLYTTVVGGTSPYTYLWSNSQSNDTASNLLAGNYYLTVTDSNGCTLLDSAEINTPSALSILMDSIINESNTGNLDGSALAVVTGATPPYSYAWSNAQTTPQAISLGAGTYMVNITDSLGCSDTASVVIANMLGIAVNTSLIQHVSCFNGDDGMAAATGSGGYPPYSYHWSNGDTTNQADSLIAGSYIVTITDSNGFTATASILITQPTSAVLATLVADADVTCFGGNDGQITSTASGGTPGYGYLWSNGDTTSTSIQLFAGYNYVTVTDTNSCIYTDSLEILEPLPIVSNLTVSQPITCNGFQNGELTTTPTGGTPGYTYNWSASSNAANQVFNLSAGSYYVVTITDSNGCVAVDSMMLLDPPTLSSTTNLDSTVSCFGGTDGVGSVQPSGGLAPYSYVWTNGDTTASANNLSAGNWWVTVTDSLGCSLVDSVQITQPLAAVGANASVLQQVSCLNGSDGSAFVQATGGTPGYTSSWSSPSSSDSALNLAAGTYSVTVTDTNGCTDTDNVLIAQPASSVSATVTLLQNASCFGGSDAAAVVSPTGGTPGYSFNWSNSSINDTVNNLSTGTHQVTVSDNNLCTTVASISVSSPNEILPMISIAQVITCAGDSNGALSAQATGGIPGYSYSWSTLDSSSSLTGLHEDLYTVTVTDQNGCFQSASFFLSEPVSLSSQANVISNVNCFGDSTGSATVSVSGGTPPYGYAWSNGDTLSAADTLPVGQYSVVITDSLNCQYTDTITITQPDSLYLLTVVDQNETLPANMNGQATAYPQGGTTPYNFVWSDGQTDSVATMLSSAAYTVTVSDANGCVANDSVFIDLVVGIVPAEVLGNWLLYPNPSRGSMTLEGPVDLDGSISINLKEMSGKIVWEMDEQSYATPIGLDFSEVATGSYFLEWISSDGTHQKMIVISR